MTYFIFFGDIVQAGTSYGGSMSMVHPHISKESNFTLIRSKSPNLSFGYLIRSH